MNEEQRAVMDSLTPEQRKRIAEIIRSAKISCDYGFDGEDEVYEEYATETLNNLARYFEQYEPPSKNNGKDDERPRIQRRSH